LVECDPAGGGKRFRADSEFVMRKGTTASSEPIEVCAPVTAALPQRNTGLQPCAPHRSRDLCSLRSEIPPSGAARNDKHFEALKVIRKSTMFLCHAP
jgi:hypothetical protein